MKMKRNDFALGTPQIANAAEFDSRCSHVRAGSVPWVWLYLMVFFLVGVAAWGQQTTGDISGIVKDASGAFVENAKVTLRDTDKKAVVRAGTSGSGGEFVFAQLPIGNYSITVEAPNFRKYLQTGIVLHVNDKLAFLVALEVGSALEEVTVQASAAQVNTEDATAAGVVTGTQVRELSLNNRVWEQLLTLVPGVSDSNNADQYYLGVTNPFGGSSTNTSSATPPILPLSSPRRSAASS